MSAEEHKARVRREYEEGMNRRDVAVTVADFVADFAPDYVAHLRGAKQTNAAQ